MYREMKSLVWQQADARGAPPSPPRRSFLLRLLLAPFWAVWFVLRLTLLTSVVAAVAFVPTIVAQWIWGSHGATFGVYITAFVGLWLSVVIVAMRGQRV